MPTLIRTFCIDAWRSTRLPDNAIRSDGKAARAQRVSAVHLNPDRTHNLPGTPQRDKQERKAV